VADGDTAVVTLNGDGHGVLCVLQIALHPYTEGDETGIQDGNVLHIKLNA
jgi:hypothetical protein